MEHENQEIIYDKETEYATCDMFKVAAALTLGYKIKGSFIVDKQIYFKFDKDCRATLNDLQLKINFAKFYRAISETKKLVKETLKPLGY